MNLKGAVSPSTECYYQISYTFGYDVNFLEQGAMRAS
jgi:hypothetical protein